MITYSHIYIVKNVANIAFPKGTVLLPNGESSGIHYQHGGYPPLILAVEDGNLIVAARSDERKFIEKGGCGVGKPTPYNRTCALHPRQQVVNDKKIFSRSN